MKAEKVFHHSDTLKNKMVVVAGGVNSTGKAIAERLADAHARIIIADINLINAEVVVQAITDKYKTQAAAVSLNTAEVKAVITILKTIDENWGETDIWINTSNLALHSQGLTKHTFSDQSIDKCMKDLFLNSREVANYMVSRKIEGIIVNVISVSDYTALDGLPGDSGLDKYISNETISLSEKLKEHGIKLFTIAPVFSQKMQMEVPNPNAASVLNNPSPDDVALIVLYCISILSKATTGKMLRLSGKNILIDPKY
jgi:NADP-dependent 3-hydroxy acid dehydrogenase YdfG